MVSIGGQKMTLAGQTVYPYGSIDISFDPLQFSLDSTFKCDLSHTPATSLLNHIDYFKILEISIYDRVGLQLASKANIYVITKALNIWPPRDLT